MILVKFLENVGDKYPRQRMKVNLILASQREKSREQEKIDSYKLISAAHGVLCDPEANLAIIYGKRPTHVHNTRKIQRVSN